MDTARASGRAACTLKHATWNWIFVKGVEMKKAIVFLSFVFVVLVTACQARAAPTATAAPSPTAAPATDTPAAPPPSPTAASAAPTAAAPTVAPTVAPTAAGPCTNAASFVADVTIPDYSHFDPREAFTKTWRVKNAG